MAHRFAPEDFPAEPLRDLRVAVLGYGNQGRAQALNLRDSGVDVMIGQREGGSADRARADGFAVHSVADAVAASDVMMLTLPDERMGDVFAADIAPHLRAGQALLFSHGFAIRFGLIQPPADVDVALVSPKGQARGVRERYLAGSGVPGLVGVHQDATGRALEIALCYAAACGYSRSLVLETTFAEETETDLFGEQAVLCGGIIELIKAGYDTLVEAGYQPEMAYFECVHETKLIIDLLVERGLVDMRRAISDTAEWGGYLAGPRLVDERTRDEMRRLLAAIRDGSFAAGWVSEAEQGKPRLHGFRDAETRSGLEAVGAELRSGMAP
jgi:ketol-acid reductoisomerase